MVGSLGIVIRTTRFNANEDNCIKAFAVNTLKKKLKKKNYIYKKVNFKVNEIF